MEHYKKLPKYDYNENPLKFWQSNHSRLPKLSILAQQYLIVQVGSVPSERVFSTAGDIVTQERSRLDPEQVDALIFLKKNMEK